MGSGWVTLIVTTPSGCRYGISVPEGMAELAQGLIELDGHTTERVETPEALVALIEIPHASIQQ